MLLVLCCLSVAEEVSASVVCGSEQSLLIVLRPCVRDVSSVRVKFSLDFFVAF